MSLTNLGSVQIGMAQTRETQPIDPFVLEGLPLFTIYLFTKADTAVPAL